MTKAELTAQTESLRDVAARTTNPCLVAQYIAISDTRVHELFLKKVADGYVFKGVHCIDREVSIREYKDVLFDFDCQPGTFCLIPQAFLVTVDFVNGHVVAITDPYIPQTFASLAIRNPINGGVRIQNVRREGDRVCADLHAWASARILGRRFEFDRTWTGCINIGGTCVTLFSGDIGLAEIEAKLCFEDGKVCGRLYVEAFGFDKSFRDCAPIG